MEIVHGIDIVNHAYVEVIGAQLFQLQLERSDGLRHIARAQILVVLPCGAKTLKCQDKEILFTSGGTESNNMAIIGTAMANKRKGMHCIVSSVEHSSVKEPFNFLEKEGFRITYLPVDKDGIVDIEALKNALDDETILVSVMYVNNEIGAVEPIEEIGHIIKDYNPDIVYHVDAIQAYGKYKIYPKKLGIDL